MATIANGNDLFAHMLPLETYEQVYQSDPDVIVAGSARSARHERMSDAVNHHAAVAAEADLQFDLITM